MGSKGYYSYSGFKHQALDDADLFSQQLQRFSENIWGKFFGLETKGILLERNQNFLDKWEGMIQINSEYTTDSN